MTRSIDQIPQYFTTEEKEELKKAYEKLSGCSDALGFILPVQGDKTVFVITEELRVSRETEEAIDELVENSLFLWETLPVDEPMGKGVSVYAFK